MEEKDFIYTVFDVRAIAESNRFDSPKINNILEEIESKENSLNKLKYTSKGQQINHPNDETKLKTQNIQNELSDLNIKLGNALDDFIKEKKLDHRELLRRADEERKFNAMMEKQTESIALSGKATEAAKRTASYTLAIAFLTFLSLIVSITLNSSSKIAPEIVKFIEQTVEKNLHQHLEEINKNADYKALKNQVDLLSKNVTQLTVKNSKQMDEINNKNDKITELNKKISRLSKPKRDNKDGKKTK